MSENLDAVARYGESKGFRICDRTIIVEGETDVRLFYLAAQKERETTGVELLGRSLAITAAGSGEEGGTRGVIRELVSLRALAKVSLLPNGKPRYRFVGLFDNDAAGRKAIVWARNLDTSILEYKDIFRLHPVMPINGNLDPKSLQATFDRENAAFHGIEWELEDLLPAGFTDAFLSECRDGVRRVVDIGAGRIHRDFSQDGKARFHRFIYTHAIQSDLSEVINVLKALRFYCGL